MRPEIIWAARGEAEKAEEKFGPMTSTHEGLGVLVEEFDELREAIHRNDCYAVKREACQVAAVALRIVNACFDRAFQERSGFKP